MEIDMALDGLFLHCIANELKQKLISSRIEKIYQPSKNELLLSFRNRTQANILLINVGGNAPRINLIASKLESPENPPMLTMLLRKNLAGAILTDIQQVKTDRIINFVFDAVNEIGDRVKRTLIVEIMAQYSNAILVDENDKIIDSVKRVDLLKSSVRQILPGLKYTLPPQQNKPSIIYDSIEDIAAKAFVPDNEKLYKQLLHSAEGISPSLCRELAYRCKINGNTVESLTNVLTDLKSEITKNRISPCIVYSEDGTPIDFSFTKLTQYSGMKKSFFSSPSELLESYYKETERIFRAKTNADDLFKLINNITERITKKISSQTADLKKAEDREIKRVYADLINSNLYSLQKGSFFYDLENYYDDMNVVRIKADPRLTPAQNAQKYYKEYRKSATAEKILTEQIKKSKEELDYILSVQDILSRATGEKEFNAVREELTSAGFLKEKNKKTKKKKVQNLPYIEYTSPSGMKVLAGKNNIQNDLLTFKTAAKNDIWFHVQKFHGSHIILVTNNTEPTDEDYLFAAQKAIENSEVKGVTKISVDYTRIKNIKKPAGAKPGFVIYHIYNTVIV